MPFSVDEPAGLKGIVELALDMRWAWNHAADHIWQRLDPVLWESTRNPWLLLKSVGSQRLQTLARDEEFVRAFRACRSEHERALKAPAWFEEAHAGDPNRPTAYFSMEFGLSEALPLYAGGLGVLAGDHLKTASDLGVPVVGIGLLYRRGYFRQVLDALGNQLEFYPTNDPDIMPILPATDRSGAWLRVPIELPGRALWLRAWVARIGRVRLYLLDSNDPENSPADRGITAELYGGGAELRLQQELCLGIGGWRLIRALGLEPDVCHLNEGHAAFAVIERAQSIVEATGEPFEVALIAGRIGTIFTTHTAVAAGFDRFERTLIVPYLERYAAELNVPTETLFALGSEPGSASMFNMAYLAVLGSGWINAVSRLHKTVSRELFHELFPRWPFAEIPIVHVTNGVHTPSWDSREADQVWTQACGKDRWLGAMGQVEEAITKVEDKTLLGMRLHNRTRMIEFVRTHLERQLASRGTAPERIADAARVLSPDALTLCFARRFTGYKRVTLLLHDEERLVRILTNPKRPVQLVMAGKAHPQDEEGKELVRRWVTFTERPDVRNHAVFLSDYDLLVAEMLVQGADVWLNTPLRPWEACGTSGMKVLVNGGLNLSELDGWWSEAYSPDLGWALGDGNVHSDETAWDDTEADALYKHIELSIVPAFYDRDKNGIAGEWFALTRASMATLTPQFSANRMTREYVEMLYLPAAAAYRRRTADGLRIAHSLERWRHSLEQCWGDLRFGVSETTGAPPGPYRFGVKLDLGNLNPSFVRVELYAEGKTRGDPPERITMERGTLAGGTIQFTATVTTERAITDFTPRALPYHPEANLPLESPFVLWQH
jgi:starch phosphorylase